MRLREELAWFDDSAFSSCGGGYFRALLGTLYFLDVSAVLIGLR